jgi:hypothetical protein
MTKFFSHQHKSGKAIAAQHALHESCFCIRFTYAHVGYLLEISNDPCQRMDVRHVPIVLPVSEASALCRGHVAPRYKHHFELQDNNIKVKFVVLSSHLTNKVMAALTCTPLILARVASASPRQVALITRTAGLRRGTPFGNVSPFVKTQKGEPNFQATTCFARISSQFSGAVLHFVEVLL